MVSRTSLSQNSALFAESPVTTSGGPCLSVAKSVSCLRLAYGDVYIFMCVVLLAMLLLDVFI